MCSSIVRCFRFFSRGDVGIFLALACDDLESLLLWFHVHCDRFKDGVMTCNVLFWRGREAQGGVVFWISIGWKGLYFLY
jgi:hypothetical protein